MIGDVSFTTRAGWCLGVGLIALCASCSSGSDNTGDTAPVSQLPVPTMPRLAFRLQQIIVDDDNDQMDDQLFTLLYDDAGLSVGELIDDNADGIAEHRFTYLYSDSRLISSQYDEYINNTTDVVRTFTYDEQGSLAALDIDRGSVLSRIEYLVGDRGVIIECAAG